MKRIKKLINNQIMNNPQMSKMWVCLECRIRWEDDNETEDATIRLVPKDTDTESLVDDEDIIYYIHDINELLDLCDSNNGSDFVIEEFYYSYM